MTDNTTRASDADREDAAEQVRSAVADGRLGLDEMDERLAATYASKTHAELAKVTHDLSVAVVPAPTPRSSPLQLRTRSGSLTKKGRWSVPSLIVVESTSGTIKLDFTEATCPHREVSVQARASSGSVVLIVPFGWAVDMDNMSTTSGSLVNRIVGHPEPGAPILRISGMVTSGTIKARHQRRTFWQWLTRVPRDPRLRRS
jgi:hypothetical protein